MEGIPDELLYEIFQELTSEDLLLHVRRVCRRWRAVVSHPAVWSHRDISDNVSSKREARFCAMTLRVAPSLRRLQCTGCSYPELEEALLASTCASRELDIVIYSDISPAMAIINQQIQGGRLQRVVLDLSCNIHKSNKVLECVLSLHLHMLKIVNGSVHEPLGWAPLPLVGSTGSVRHLVYEGCHADGLLACVMRKNSGTLQHLEVVDENLASGLSMPILEMLPTCTNLTTIKIPITVDMEKLLEVRGLTNLSLTTFYSTAEDFDIVKAPFIRFFQRVEGLQYLQFQSLTDHEGEWKFVMHAVVALASSEAGALALQSLSSTIPIPEVEKSLLESKLSFFPKKPSVHI